MRVLIHIVTVGLLMMPGGALAQSTLDDLGEDYNGQRDITYLTRDGWEGKLDIYAGQSGPTPKPTLIWFHGGNSMGGSKNGAALQLLPYLERGWSVVNVEHRLAGTTLAPAALQNSLCAVRWIREHGSQYGIDADRLVLSGASSGGWFAVAAAMSPREDGWDAPCPGTAEPNVAAVVNWYGNWDLADVLEGPNAKPYAPGWVRGLPNPLEIARRMSPLPFDNRRIPPTISIHGDADQVVPYSQSVRLYQALGAAGVQAELVTIPGGGHGGFPAVERERAFDAIWAFLTSVGLASR